MEPDEVQAEIEQRKKRAEDLRIREVLWCLYDSHFMRYEAWIREDPQWVYPGIGEAIKLSDKRVQFLIAQTVHQLIYKEGPATESKDRRGVPEEKIVPATLALRVNDQRVFKFEICRRTRYTDTCPLWDDQLGEVTRFIDGLWVLELTDLLEKIRAHEDSVRNQREGPRKARELEALKKRFGL
jgi:hypothetical protein